MVGRQCSADSGRWAVGRRAVGRRAVGRRGIGFKIGHFQRLLSRQSSFRAQRYITRMSRKKLDSVFSGNFLNKKYNVDPESSWPNLEPSPTAGQTPAEFPQSNQSCRQCLHELVWRNGKFGNHNSMIRFFPPTGPTLPSFRAQRSGDPESRRPAEAHGFEAFEEMTKKT